MAAAAATEFDPALHGFQFRNRFSGLDIVKEINAGFGDVARNVSGSAEFWEGWGLCGGMSWHALDRFYDQEPVPELRDVPEGDTELFRKLARRQFDSFRRASLLTQCVRWQSRQDRRRWWDFRETILQLTLKEWVKVKASVDQGFPPSLTLIRTTTDPSRNHQVIAVAYQEDQATGSGEIDLYDPNHPNLTPKIRIKLDGGDAGKAHQSTGEKLRGFFVWPYDETQRSRGDALPT